MKSLSDVILKQAQLRSQIDETYDEINETTGEEKARSILFVHFLKAQLEMLQWVYHD